MIDAFLSSWDLFQHAYLAGWIAGVVLSLAGFLLVARNQVFLGAAVSEFSAFGLALVTVVGAWAGRNAGIDEHLFHYHPGHDHSSGLPFPFNWMAHPAFSAVVAMGFAAAAACLTGLANFRRETREAASAGLFLFGAAATVLLLINTAHGTEQINHVMFSTLIGATAADVWILLGFLVVWAAGVLPRRREFLLFVTDPASAAACGVPVRAWSFAAYAFVGLLTGFSMRAAGMLYTFGCLVLPVMAARGFAREGRTVLWLAPALSLAAGVSGFILANHHDLPPAQGVVLLLSLAWLTSLLFRRLRA